MGFRQADVPDVDPAEFEKIPTMERMKLLCLHWVDYGFGAPKIMHSLYLVKGLFFIIAGWLLIGLTTPGLPLLDLGAWWGGEMIVLQKSMLWVVLWSATGFNESWGGPLAFKFTPNTAGYRYWIRTGTLRLPPWPGKIPLTGGDERKAIDVCCTSGCSPPSSRAWCCPASRPPPPTVSPASCRCGPSSPLSPFSWSWDCGTRLPSWPPAPPSSTP